MPTTIRAQHDLQAITTAIVASYTECSRINHLGREPLPRREAVADIIADLFEVIYPGFARRENLHEDNIEYYIGSVIDALHDKLTKQFTRAFRHDLSQEAPHTDFQALAQKKVIEFLKRLPKVRDLLDQDVAAAYRGDPAARSHLEIIFCYPGLEAITVYRLAHVMLELGVPYLPRMMTEFAHSKSGIDIHPGARIGPAFFIDHGTGVVIGETCEIGTGVKLYQGVTLGALSFAKDENGDLVRGNKRHPTLLDEVVVYANATILGGKTIIGERAVIGSNVWLTHSVDPETVVVLEKPALRLKGSKSAEEALMYHI